ncbi:MAG: ABC transporter substrate-binding protein [Acetobacteraceae bacterium]|nr:ABC transporter substrate-binding protein [Acetobacteraceae bacterium]
MPTRRAALAAGLALPMTARAAAAQAAPLRVIAFAGASNWPIWAAQANGIFARHGVEVAMEFTPNSRALFRNMHEGRFDLALTAIDNILAYNSGQGEEPLSGPVGFAALFGVDNGLLSVMAQPEIGSLQALAGRSVSVDAMTTGFAFVLREILERAGVVDRVTFEAVGGGAQRLAALLEGRQAATLLNTPLDLAAEARGMRRLARAAEVIGPYQGVVGMVRRDRLEELRPRLVAFARAFREAVAWCADPANREGALAAFLANQQGSTRPVAERAHAALFDPANGIYRDIRIDMEGLATVIALRRKFGRDPGPAERHLDLSVRAAALA